MNSEESLKSLKMADPVSTWASDRKETIKELRQLGESINEHAKNAKIASAVGGGTSVAAGLGAAACYVAAPFTFGGSLVPAVALTGVAVAGGVTSFGATITNHFIEKGYIGRVQEALDKDRSSFNALKKAIDKAKEISLAEGIEGGVNIGTNIPGNLKIGTTVARMLVLPEEVAVTLLRLGQTVRFAGYAVAIVAVPLDVLFFVKDLIDLSKGNVSKAAKKVLELADELAKELEDIMADA